MARLPKGHVSNSSSVEIHGEGMNFGSRPSVGQSGAYQSGGNAHGKHEARKSEPSGGPKMPMSQPRKQTY